MRLFKHSVQTAAACSEHLPVLQMGWLVHLWSRSAVGGPSLEDLLWQTAAGVLGALCACSLHVVAPAQLTWAATDTLQACLSALAFGSAILAALALPEALRFVQPLPTNITD